MSARLSTLAAAIGAELHGADGDYAGASIDTRSLASGTVFFALAGSRTDGHAYAARAACLGAAAAVVSRLTDARLPQLLVADVQTALHQAAAATRARFVGPVVGVTGSNGKTTVKQMLAAILARAGATLATQGNYNNELGVPLTLMRLAADRAYAVIEMGASHAGEIAMLAELARPDVGLVTNAGDAHLEGFGSREGVARAKGELYSALGRDGVAIINADDDYAGLWAELAGARPMLGFALAAGRGVDIHASAIQLAAQTSRFMLHTPAGDAPVELPLAGEHNVANALAAAAAASALHIEPATIAAGLRDTSAAGARLAVSTGVHGVRLVDDSYNANPGSLAAALGWLAGQPAPRWAALGDMGELGAASQAAHRDAGTAAREAGIERLWATGDYSRLSVEAFGVGGQWYADHATLNRALRQALAVEARTVTLLVKGSRNARMDRVAAALTEAPAFGGKGGVAC